MLLLGLPTIPLEERPLSSVLVETSVGAAVEEPSATAVSNFGRVDFEVPRLLLVCDTMESRLGPSAVLRPRELLGRLKLVPVPRGGFNIGGGFAGSSDAPMTGAAACDCPLLPFISPLTAESSFVVFDFDLARKFEKKDLPRAGAVLSVDSVTGATFDCWEVAVFLRRFGQYCRGIISHSFHFTLPFRPIIDPSFNPTLVPSHLVLHLQVTTL